MDIECRYPGCENKVKKPINLSDQNISERQADDNMMKNKYYVSADSIISCVSEHLLSHIVYYQFCMPLSCLDGLHYRRGRYIQGFIG
jgi:hypothetical protein